MRSIVFTLIFLGFSYAGFSQAYDGYTLYFPQGNTRVYLVDMSGNIFHTWNFSANATTCYATYLLPGQVLLRTVNHQGNYFQGGPVSGEVQKVDWNGNILWDYIYSTQDYCTHHDIHPMPNGNVLLIAYERKTPVQVVQAGCSQSLEMWPDKIVEIQPSGTSGGTVVWEWHAWDHLVQDHDPSKSNYGVVAGHPELLNINFNTSKDWMHMNGIDYNEARDQIVFSSHALNEVYVIDHSTTTAEAAGHTGGNSGKGGDFLYRWGNPAAYQATGSADFNVVHDAHWVPSDNPLFPDALAGYNNKGGAGGKTCVDIFMPPYDGYNYSLTPGTSYAPATYDWRVTYSGPPSQDNGNSQQLPNGNTLICIGMSGFIYEIDSNQNQVWSKTVGSTLPQSFRYPPCYITGNYAASATGTPEPVCPGETAQLDVTATGGDVYTYAWTSDPPGYASAIKNPVVNPSVTTTYIVTIKNGPCSAVDSVTITVKPVPPTPVVTISGDSLVSNAQSGNQWFLNGTAIPGATGQSLVPVQSGTYTVQVTGTNGCLSAMSAPVILEATGEMSDRDAVCVYPNPTTGLVTISGKLLQDGHFKVTLYDVLGNPVQKAENRAVMDLSRLPAGVYYLAVATTRSKSNWKKIILVK